MKPVVESPSASGGANASPTRAALGGDAEGAARGLSGLSSRWVAIALVLCGLGAGLSLVATFAGRGATGAMVHSRGALLLWLVATLAGARLWLGCLAARRWIEAVALLGPFLVLGGGALNLEPVRGLLGVEHLRRGVVPLRIGDVAERIVPEFDENTDGGALPFALRLDGFALIEEARPGAPSPLPPTDARPVPVATVSILRGEAVAEGQILPNQPVWHGSYAIYLAWYSLRPDAPPAAALLVVHDPGWPWVLAGMIWTALGVAILCWGRMGRGGRRATHRIGDGLSGLSGLSGAA